MKKSLLLLCLLTILGACSGDAQSCKTQESCLRDAKCQCWCSQKCGYRKKEATDNPIYIENDQWGKHCYCKEWDYIHYEERCIEHMDIKEPAGAK